MRSFLNRDLNLKSTFCFISCVVLNMPDATDAAERMSLKLRIDSVRFDHWRGDSSIVIGGINDLTNQELANPESRIFINGDIVVLVDCPLRLHVDVRNWVANFMRIAVVSKLADPSYNSQFEIRTDASRIMCSTIRDVFSEPSKTVYYSKMPDVSLIFQTCRLTHLCRGPMVWEIAYRNESVKTLVHELFCWVGPTTDVIYACGLKIEETVDGTGIDHIRLIVLERTCTTNLSHPTPMKWPKWGPQASLQECNLDFALGRVLMDRIIRWTDLKSGALIGPIFSAARLNAWCGLRMFASDLYCDISMPLRCIFSDKFK